MEFLTVREVAIKLNTSEPQVTKYIRANRLKAVKHGRRYVIEREVLNKALKEGF